MIMTTTPFRGIELLPNTEKIQQLFILLHDASGRAADLLPLANQLKAAFPEAAYIIPDGFEEVNDNATGRQWYSEQTISAQNRITRIATALPTLHTLIQQTQQRFGIPPASTALVGFSQGAIMALECYAAYDGLVGRIISFAGCFAQLPQTAPQQTTLYLLHGEDDQVIPADRVYEAYEHLAELNGDVTIDVLSTIGHELHPAMIERGIYRLQTVVPLRTWQQALTNN